MIYKLRKKFIKICILSFVATFVVLFAGIFTVSTLQTNATLDNLSDIIYQNNGSFPEFPKEEPGREPPRLPDGTNRESPFTTRFFTVKYDIGKKAVHTDTKSISNISEETALEYAQKAMDSNTKSGWIGDFRYNKYLSSDGTTVIFISGMDAKGANTRFMLSAAAVFALSSVIIIFLVILLSRRAVKPAAESLEKQKQFITDAGHELKTPLTLIRTNLEIMESENGKSEWLSDTKAETDNMTALVNQLVSLARMDEENAKLNKSLFSLSDAVGECALAFYAPIEKSNRHLFATIEPDVMYNGDEEAIRRLVAILLDNAMKYCDDGGNIGIILTGGAHPTLIVDNSYRAVETLELDKLFDRFYRADRARTAGSGFGIGLSLAKAIAEKHKGTIQAVSIDKKLIRFQVKL